MPFEVCPVYDDDGKTIIAYEICNENNYCIPCDSKEAAENLAEEMNKSDGEGDDDGMKM